MANCSNTSMNLIPLIDGEGLYPDGTNNVPIDHLNKGILLANEIVPRKANGQPNPNGKIGFISLGFSNTRWEFQTFMNSNPSTNTKLVLINGAQPGKTAENWSNPNDICWSRFLQAITNSGLTYLQVQVVWIKITNLNPTEGDVELLQSRIEAILSILVTLLPNIKIAYFSNRVYGGYSDSIGSPEPYAHDNGYAIKNIIEKQINGLLPFEDRGKVAPYIIWSAYLWADGLNPRSDGLIWECIDFEDDGLHTSELGKAKISGMLTDFFTTHQTAVPWFN